jgi:hypothetical protein
MLFVKGIKSWNIKKELTGPKACLAPGSRLLLELMCWLLAKLKAAVVVVVAGVAGADEAD